MGSFAQRLGGSSSGGGSPTISSQLSSLGIDTSQFERPVPAGEPQGPLGWAGGLVSNIIGDVGEFASGIGALGGVALSDLVSAGTDIVEKPLSMVGLMEDKDREYRSDDLLKSLVFDPGKLGDKGGPLAAVAPGFQSYLEEQYGVNPLKADLMPDIGKVGSALYNDPLNTALDVYGAAAFGGRKVGNAARKTYRALDEGAEVSASLKRTLPGLDPESPLYDDPTNPATFLDAPGGVRRRMIESGGKPGLDVTPLPVNPVTRGVRNRVNNLLTYDVESMGDDVKRFAEEFAALPDSEAKLQRLNALEPELAQKVRVYNQAKEWGVTRLDKPKVGMLRVRGEAAKKIANWRGTFYHMRNEDVQKIQDAFEAYDLTEEQLQNLFKPMQGYAPRQAFDMLPMQQVEDLIAQGGGWLKELPIYDDIVAKYTALRQHIDTLDDPQAIEAAMEHAEDLSEYIDVTRRTLAKQPVDPEAATIARLRWEWQDLLHESIKAEKMGGGYQQHLRRTYGPLLIEETAPRLDAIDPVTGQQRLADFEYDKLSEGAGDYWKLKRNELKSQRLQAPIYYPHLDARKFKASEVLARTGNGMQSAVGNAPFKRNEYSNLIQGLYLTDDPVEAMSRRAAHVRRIVETEKMVTDLVGRFGRKIEKWDDLGPNEKYFSPTAIKMMYRTRGEIDIALSKAAETSVDSHEFGDIVKDTIKKLEQDAAGRLTTPGMQDVYAIPATVARQLESFSKYNIGPMGRLFVDGPVNVWRTNVLAFSPRWILNNLLGNIVFLKMQGGKLSEVIKFAVDPEFRKAVNKYIESLPDEMQAQVGEGMFGSSQMSRTSLGEAANTEVGQLATKVKESRIVRPFSTYARKMEHANEVIEQAFRKVSLMTAVDKRLASAGLKKSAGRFFRSHAVLEEVASKGVTPKLVAKAVDDMNYFFNDYRRMSSFERNVMRRFISPFWSFYKHVGKLVLTYPITHPERATVIRLMGEVGNELDADFQGLLPEYLQSSMPFGGGAQPGSTRFLNTRGANPLELASQVTQDPMGAPAQMLGPYAGIAYELLSGRDSLTGRQFTSPGVGGAFGSENQYKAVFDEFGNVTGVESQPTNVRPGVFETLVDQVPLAGLARDAISAVPGVGAPGVGSRYSTGEEITDTTGANEFPVDFGQKLMQMLGVSTTDFNVEEHIERQAGERQAALVEVLRNLGIMAPAEED